MHTSIMAKMTKELVLLTDSRKHYEALLHDDSGIKVTLNEYDVMELNDVLVEVNNLTYYTHETELRMQRYGMTNMA